MSHYQVSLREQTTHPQYSPSIKFPWSRKLLPRKSYLISAPFDIIPLEISQKIEPQIFVIKGPLPWPQSRIWQKTLKLSHRFQLREGRGPLKLILTTVLHFNCSTPYQRASTFWLDSHLTKKHVILYIYFFLIRKHFINCTKLRKRIQGTKKHVFPWTKILFLF